MHGRLTARRAPARTGVLLGEHQCILHAIEAMIGRSMTCTVILHAIRSPHASRRRSSVTDGKGHSWACASSSSTARSPRASACPRSSSSERLGVSRTPLRLALSTLAHEGLLEPLPGGGFVVRSFTRADVSDAIELRGVLEGTAARLAAERLESADELDPLAAAVELLDEVARGRHRRVARPLRRAQRRLPRTLVEAGEEPDARPRDRGQRRPPVRRAWSVAQLACVAPALARDPDRRSAPAPGAGRRTAGASWHARGGDRPRARAARTAQPRARARGPGRTRPFGAPLLRLAI